MILIVGGGQAGIAAARACQMRRLSFTAVEAADGLGGLWRSPNGYRTLRMNTSKQRSAFQDFPYPQAVPDFPSQGEVGAYLQAYAEHHQLLSHYRFGTRVRCVRPAPGGWQIAFDNAPGMEAQHVIIAIGPNRRAMPWDRGGFTGRVIAGAEYRDQNQLRADRVLVIGGGASAADIACDAVAVAGHVTIALRHVPFILPRYVLGRPVDHWLSPWRSRWPMGVRRFFCRGLLRAGRARQQRFGLPAPTRKFFEGLPTVSTELLHAVAAGRIAVRKVPVSLSGSMVTFADGLSEPFDVIVSATGYRPEFPALPPGAVFDAAGRVRLYQSIVPPDHPGLFVVGFFQALGAALPVAEAQSAWVADVVAGTRRLPSADSMHAEILMQHRRLFVRYGIEVGERPFVDPFPYVRRLRNLTL